MGSSASHTARTSSPRPESGRQRDRPPLGDVAPPDFMRRYWQKRALLIRDAVPGFRGLLSRPELFALAASDRVESRLVRRGATGWTLQHGPFPARELARLPDRDWTLLVQGLNLHVPAADALLRRFAFLPYARLDDVMVSYAVPGGGVGPHLDAYDVFLLQGDGRRRWRYGRQADHTFRPGLPLRILRRFTPGNDAVLGPGDMLYLPPAFAHDGVAVDVCTTYSIGFRAPTANELVTGFLDHLRDHLDVPGAYSDPDLHPVRHPARLDADLHRRYAALVARMRWTPADVRRFVGAWLSEPKPSVFFDPPEHPMGSRLFRQQAGRRGVRLDARTRLLYDRGNLFINGAAQPWDPALGPLRRLADERMLPAEACAALPGAALDLLHDWYRDGCLHPGSDR